MSGAAAANWPEDNQRHLMARLGDVRDALLRHAVRGSEVSAEAQTGSGKRQARRRPAKPHAEHSALETLCGAFGLSRFERDVLLMCAGMELDSTFAGLCADAQGSPQRAYPTFSLALAVFSDAHWSAVTPASSLRRWRLIEVGAGETLMSSPLRIDERVLHYLAGISYLDPRLVCLIEPEPAPAELAPSHREVARQIASGMRRSAESGGTATIYLGGDEAAGKRAVAAFACAQLGMQLHVLRCSNVPASSLEREALARLWEREAALSHGVLLLEDDAPENRRAVVSWLDHTEAAFLVASREPFSLFRGELIRLEVKKPTPAEQRLLWQESLGETAASLNGELEPLVSQFDLGLADIRAASASVREGISEDAGADLGLKLWDACRAGGRARLDDLAQQIEPMAGWDDLVLPAPQLRILREIGAQVRQRARVYEAWGFAAKASRGLGVSALFTGASGTGKTMAAEVLARELRLDLYRIDLSAVVSKYIGETEKNLRRVFDVAEAAGAVLLFDEADALFGKRSEVKDSHDRYANIEVSYLLQRMEAYRGLAILTTNLKNALDSAFLRRIRFIVQFPFPDAAQRADIWRRIFPRETPVEGLDIGKLARLNIAGGNIRNIALNAAFLAADLGDCVRMSHLLSAARSEYAKIEKPLTGSEFKDWV